MITRRDVRLHRGAGMGVYDVLLDGERIGHVQKWEQHFNLRRPLVARGWQAFTAEHGKAGNPSHASGAWASREAAVEALLSELNLRS